MQPRSATQGRSQEFQVLTNEQIQAAAAEETRFGAIPPRAPVAASLLALFLLCLTAIFVWPGEHLADFPTQINRMEFPSKAETGASADDLQDTQSSRGDAGDATKLLGNEKVSRFKILKRYPHDPNAFTQGLLYLGKDTLYESTGLRGRSEVRKVELQTGRVKARHSIKPSDFGEGLAYYKGCFWQLLWKKRTVYQFDARTLDLVGTHSMPKEFDFNDGWGLASTSDGLGQLYAPEQLPSKEEELYVTDSGTKLYRVDFSDGTFKLNKAVTIKTPQGDALEMANELEVIDDNQIWANVYDKDCIARINPRTGKIFGWILADNLRKENLGSAADVLNGIAFDRSGDRFFVTGKQWSQLFEVQLVPERTIPDKEVRRMCVPQFNIFRR